MNTTNATEALKNNPAVKALWSSCRYDGEDLSEKNIIGYAPINSLTENVVDQLSIISKTLLSLFKYS